MHTIIFTTLAKYQTIFFVGVANELRKRGYGTAFISYHERSVEYIKDHQHLVFNVFKMINRKKKVSVEELQRYIQHYEIENLNRLISHEKVSFEEKQSDVLFSKLCNYLDVLESAFSEIKQRQGEIITLVQEAGGFLSLIAAYLVARKNGIDNIFIEPSFFRGRVFFVRNTFSSLSIFEESQSEISKAVRDYLEETKRKKKIVIPKKDSHQYKDPSKKILNLYNIRRFFEKLLDKYVLGYKEEFSYISVWTRRHIRMFLNKYLLTKYYQDILDDSRLIYYPFHVPTDFALTIRSPEYLDQYALLDYIARNIPVKHKLIIKEHPALVGALQRSRIKELLKNNDNIIMLKPWTNNFDILKAVDLVLTVNSKAGAEAILSKKKVIVLGDCFYRDSKFVTYVDSLRKLPGAICRVLDEDAKSFDDDEIYAYFQNVWDHSYPGELYLNELENFKIFSDSLDKYFLKLFAK